ncbi:MAG TPA: ABC transporter permease [Thermoanaerobaculia bacterium]|nr:ABC transporter permease [Thermoanaerobaculia bacterium]
MATLLKDLRYGVRSLLNMPLLAVAALACIAIGVGATVSVFTLLNATLLQRLPYPDADRLVRVWATHGPEEPRRDLSYLNYQDLRAGSRTIEQLEAAARTRLAILNDVGVERVRGESVTPGYFAMIGVEPALGRTFAPEEYAADAPHLILIGHDLWQRRFGGRRDVVGQTLEARGAWGGEETTNRPYQVLGVLPEGFTGTIEDDESEFWLPMAHFEPQANLERRGQRILWTLGKLAPGATVEQADQEMATLGRTLAAEYPDDNDGFGARAERLGENWREGLRGGLYLLLGAALLLLLIACTNIANLLLARLARRRHELTLRMVLGAQRQRVLRQLLTESLLLALAGGAIGVALAWLFVDLYMDLVAEDVPDYVTVGLDWRVVLTALGVVALTGLAFGVLPAWFGARVDPGAELKEEGRGSSATRGQRRSGQLLVGAEVALTIVLLIAASLMFRSYDNLRTVELGYDADNLLRMSVTLDRSVYPAPEDWRRMMGEVKQVVARQSGVEAVSAIGGILPPSPDIELAMTFPALRGGELENVHRHSVDPDFLATMDMELLHGRNLSEADRPDGVRVALASETLARVIGGGDARAAVGEQVQFVVARNPPQTSQPYEIVGVVEDVLYHGPMGERPFDYDVYLTTEQVPDFLISLAVRTAGPPEPMMDRLTREVARVAAPSPVHWVQTIQGEIEKQYSDSRFYTALIVVYSLSAVLLAVIGIYGVLANSVTRRFRELGIRVAIGAQNRDLLAMVVAQSMKVVLLGALVGVAIALVGTRVMSSLLYGVAPTDPVTFGLVLGGLLALAFVASYLPARRATRVDPVVALRHQ